MSDVVFLADAPSNTFTAIVKVVSFIASSEVKSYTA